MSQNVEFNIVVKMQERWVPHFLAMLRMMEYNGNIGRSIIVAINSDGDGDFRPNFIWSEALNATAKPVNEDSCSIEFDAG